MAEAIGVNTFGNNDGSLYNGNFIYNALTNGYTNIHYLKTGDYASITSEINLIYIESTGYFIGTIGSAFNIGGHIGTQPLWLYIPNAPKNTQIAVPGGSVKISSSSDRITYIDANYFTMTCTVLMLTV